MHTAKTIHEETENLGNNETRVRRGVYQMSDGSFDWLTHTRSGNCKRLQAAMRKAGVSVQASPEKDK